MSIVNNTSKQGGELVSRPKEQAERLERLNEIACALLPNYGPYWHRHSVNTMRVEAVARMLYIMTSIRRL